MNQIYLKELFEKNKEKFMNSEIEINSEIELENQLISYIVSNMQYDFNIDIDIKRLFDIATNELNRNNYDIEIEK